MVMETSLWHGMDKAWISLDTARQGNLPRCATVAWPGGSWLAIHLVLSSTSVQFSSILGRRQQNISIPCTIYTHPCQQDKHVHSSYPFVCCPDASVVLLEARYIFVNYKYTTISPQTGLSRHFTFLPSSLCCCDGCYYYATTTMNIRGRLSCPVSLLLRVLVSIIMIVSRQAWSSTRA